MAWNNTDVEKLRHLLRGTIGPTVKLSQVLSLAPYPLTLFQSNCSLASVRIKALIFLRLLVSIAVTILTVSSMVVLYFYYPELLYMPTVPMFIKILYYVGCLLQVLTVGNLMIGSEQRRVQYEQYFEHVLVLVRHTASMDDCEQTIWYRNTVKALLVMFSALILVLPCAFASVTLNIRAIPYTITQLVPFAASAMILLQYYCVIVHLSSIIRKTNGTLKSLLDRTERQKTSQKSTYLHHHLNHGYHSLKIEERCFELIEQQREIQIRTMEIAGILSNNFAVVIILIVVSTFSSVNIELLELYQCIKYATLSPFYITLKGLFAGIKFFFYVLIAYPNWLIQKENHQTLTLLYKINRAACTDDTNGVIEHYISQIANMQGVHQACGMVDLDMKLISNAVTAITSIMVVLIQFSDSGS